jgi:hypothetical protein
MTMIKFKHLAAITILSVIASPVLAQAGVQEPGVHAKNLRSADLSIGSPQPSHRSIGTVGKSTVWLAPVGHRQPRAADIPSSGSEPKALSSLDQENAIVDRKINSICRGC